MADKSSGKMKRHDTTYSSEGSGYHAVLRYARILLERYNGGRGGKKLPYRFDA